jgi:hypothetical protein
MAVSNFWWAKKYRIFCHPNSDRRTALFGEPGFARYGDRNSGWQKIWYYFQDLWSSAFLCVSPASALRAVQATKNACLNPPNLYFFDSQISFLETVQKKKTLPPQATRRWADLAVHKTSEGRCQPSPFRKIFRFHNFHTKKTFFFDPKIEVILDKFSALFGTRFFNLLGDFFFNLLGDFFSTFRATFFRLLG